MRSRSDTPVAPSPSSEHVAWEGVPPLLSPSSTVLPGSSRLEAAGVHLCRPNSAVNYVLFSVSCLTAKIIFTVRGDRGHSGDVLKRHGVPGSRLGACSGPSLVTCLLQQVTRAECLGLSGEGTLCR